MKFKDIIILITFILGFSATIIFLFGISPYSLFLIVLFATVMIIQSFDLGIKICDLTDKFLKQLM